MCPSVLTYVPDLAACVVCVFVCLLGRHARPCYQLDMRGRSCGSPTSICWMYYLNFLRIGPVCQIEHMHSTYIILCLIVPITKHLIK